MKTSKNSNINRIIVLSICIHILLLFAVLDIYFKSPLENGMTPLKSIDDPPSKRVVIFVADGLRAQAVLNENENVTSFLTKIRKERGAWGVSHAGIPTESRTNHVAIFGGIYEDPSAVLKSFQEFPIDFDTVLNESKHSWVIGSPKVIKSFNKDDKKHVKILAYSTEMEDFETANQTILDEWVFNKMKELLKESKNEFEENGNIFSLHLSGTDMSGHAFKPYSDKYKENIKFIDRNVEIIENLVKEKFPDNLTTFIFTSDHGMTDWGSHGSGSDEETFTPFIIWGAGIKINSTRQDTNQTNIASLISTLLGNNFPINSIGKIPTNYLNLTNERKLQLLVRNLIEIFNIFEMKQERVKNQSAFYTPILSREEFNANITEILNATDQNYENLFLRCDQLFEKILEGIEFFNDYYKCTLLFFVSTGFLLWIFYVCVVSYEDVMSLNIPSLNDKKIPEILFTFTGVLIIFSCFQQSFSIFYYAYLLFPNFMLYLLVKKRNIFPYISTSISEIPNVRCMEILFYIFFLCVFFVSFYYRFFFSVMMEVISCMIYFDKEEYKSPTKYYCIVLCLILSIFPALPVMFTNFHMVHFFLGYATWTNFLFFIFVKKFYKFNENVNVTFGQKLIFIIQNICLSLGFLSAVYTSPVGKWENNSGDIIVKLISWIIFLLPICLIPFSMSFEGVRILTIFMGFAPFYLMTTTSYEMIFLSFYSCLIILWILMEKGLKSESKMFEFFRNFRKCLIFVVLVVIGYFGTGNVTSLSSFDPMWVRCFLTSYKPFKITILIFLKQYLPLFLTTCCFRNIVLGKRLNVATCFSIILIITDVMVFYFMLSIKNVGTWAEMGNSLSRFIFMDFLTIAILGFYFISYSLMSVKIRLDYF